MSALRTARAGIAAALTALVTAWPATAQEASTQQADVLAIGGSVTEIVAALGQQHRLKARDTTSTYPDAVTALPDVGYMRALSPEGILSVAPALILAEEGAGPPETLEVIRAANLPLVEVPNALDTDGILRKIAILGRALDVPEAAQALSNRVESEMQAATQAAARPEGDRKRVLFVLSTMGGRITASGSGTAADAIIRMAGGVNAIGGIEGYKQLTDEAVGRAAPDVILMMDRSGDHAITDAGLFAMPAIRLTPAAATGAVVRMDGLLLLGFGPRTARAISQLSAALYGPGG